MITFGEFINYVGFAQNKVITSSTRYLFSSPLIGFWVVPLRRRRLWMAPDMIWLVYTLARM